MSRVIDVESVTGSLAVSVRRAATMLGVSDRHLWNEIKAGKLRTVRSGTRVLVPMEAIRDYLKPDPMAKPKQPPAQVMREKKPSTARGQRRAK